MCYGVWGMDAHLAGNGLGSSQIVCDIRGYVLSEVLVIRVTTVFSFSSSLIFADLSPQSPGASEVSNDSLNQPNGGGVRRIKRPVSMVT